MAKARYIIFYHDKKTPQLKSRIYTKDGIVVTFDSLTEAEKVATKLRATHSNVVVEAEGGSEKKPKKTTKTKHEGTTRTVTPKKVSRKDIAAMASLILHQLRTGKFHGKGEADGVL